MSIVRFPDIHVEVFKAAQDGDPGGVDNPVQPAQAAGELLHCSRNGRGIDKVDLPGDNLGVRASTLFGCCREAAIVSIQQSQARTFRCKELGCRTANSGGCPRDKIVYLSVARESSVW